MHPHKIAILAFFGFLSIAHTTKAENLQDLNQLLTTKSCEKCDLSGSGLVTSDLSRAKLSGANLTNANLSQANLSGADLSGADLSGASLYGANLTNANLTNAILDNTDLRNAYLGNAQLIGVNLENTYIQGTIGIPEYAAKPEQFHNWGALEAQRGNYQAAISNYSRAINLEPNFAPAYFARGLARYRLGDEKGATQDVQLAAGLFEQQKNQSAYEATQNFLKNIESIRNSAKKDGPSGIEKFLSGVGSILLNLF